jgi:DNA-binding NtrC family response regulator
MKPTILIITQNENSRESLKEAFHSSYDLTFVPDVPAALKILKKKIFEIGLLDRPLTGKKGMDGLKQLKRQEGITDFVVIVPFQQVEKAVEAVRLGAYDHLVKPFSMLEAGQLFERILIKRAQEKENRFWRVEMMALFTGKENLTRDDIPTDYLGKPFDRAQGRHSEAGRTKDDSKSSLKKSRLQFERQCIRRALERARGNQTLAAKSLGLHRNTLIWKLKTLKLEEDYRRIVRKRRGK